jgi:hemolysin type calcium-binding protein
VRIDAETHRATHRRRLGRAALSALAVCLPLVAPAVAPAATAQVKDGRLLFTGGEDERNMVSLSTTARSRGFRFDLVDGGTTALLAGPGCTSTSVNSVRCDASGFRLLTGNLDDTVVFRGVAGRGPIGRIDTGPDDDAVAADSPVDANGGPDDDVLFAQPSGTETRGGTLRGGDGDDRLTGRAQAGPRGPATDPQRLFGGRGNDELTGGEELFGSGGDDRLDGQAGRDRLRGEAGNDSLVGSSGRDRFSGGRGLDLIDSADGDAGGFPERIFCGTGTDRVSPNGVDRLARDCNLVDGPDERMTAFPVSRGRRLRFRLRCKRATGCRGAIRLRRPGRRTFARRRYSLGVGDAKTIRVPLSRAARRALRRRSGVRTRVTTDALAYTVVLKR